MSNEEEKEEEDVGADAGLSEPGVPGVPWHPQILTHQLTLSQPEGSNYAHQITKGGFKSEETGNFFHCQNKYVFQITILSRKFKFPV